MPARRNLATTVIASGQELSTAVSLGCQRVCGFLLPSSWTAAKLTVQVATGEDPDNLSWKDVYDAAGLELQIEAAADRYVYFDPAILAGVSYMRLRSGTAGTPVNQAADRTIKIFNAPI